MTGPLNKYAKNIYSQNGEDGILHEIFKRLNLGQSENWCVEFGAWDGKYLSNTFAFVENGWHAVYIEGDEEKFSDLLVTSSNFSSITPLHAMVSPVENDQNSLDSLLKKTVIPHDFELLSIDIDSYDLEIWESIKDFKPKVVVIEINSSVFPGIIWRHSKNTPGNTFTATLNVALQKGYTLICHTGNLIFLRDDLLDSLGLEKRFVDYPELLFLYESEWIKPQSI